MSEEKAPKSEAEASDAENAESRLNELLRRSKVFADFVAGKGSCSVRLY
jgi:tetrahydromethanopterin S-methyltransferase subunit G